MTLERMQWAQVGRLMLPFVLSFAALAWLTFPTLEGIVSRWLKFDESYSHGLLMLAVSLFLVVRTCLNHPVRPGFYPIWLLPFFLALIGYGLGDILRIQAARELVVVPLLLGVLAVFMGWRQVRHFIIPIGLLFFTVPVWDFLSWTLQVITVEINQLLLGMMNIEFRVEGVFVYLIGVGAFEIAHGCSGLRYLLVGQSLALLYGELNLTRLRSRVVLFAVGVALALMANWIRVFVIIYMGYETNMQTSLIEDHDNFGWWVFAGTLVPLFFVGRWLETSALEQTNATAEVAAHTQPTPYHGIKRLTTGVVAMVALPLAFWALLPSTERNVRAEPAPMDLRLDGEQYGTLFSNRLEGWRPRVRNPDRAYVQTLFDRTKVSEGAGASETLYSAVYSYDYQRHSAELIQYSNRLYNREEWHTEDLYEVDVSGPATFRGVTIRNRATGKTIDIAYTYYVEGFWETDDLRAKLAQVRGFANKRTDASWILYGVSCDECDRQARLADLIDNTFDSVVQAVNQQYRP
ncbi:exosortase/archaeosortase family protein [Marinobacter panjinensis]|uniref:Exosortase/archaeosortase family protein n=1 Tax=Marinobacter panjinensis TaxID=2576384 RepID=A0A4U6R305_9GAMM|nr:exosortase [Marinobacter panjinensis]MCR8915832.1 exosortase [Marinobacter panjinensis]TKV67192.1 exosortase/archaeosortase family protein [Marinobacter panjinensis]